MNFGIGQLLKNQDARNPGSNPQKKSRKFNLERRRSFEFIALCRVGVIRVGFVGTRGS